MGGDPRTVLTDATSSSPIARSCFLRGRDESSSGSGHSPFHRGYGVGGHHKTTALITVLLATSAATAIPTHSTFTSGRKSGRLFIEKSLMEKKAKLMRNCSVRTSVGDRGVRKECAQRIPSALSTQASPIQRRQFCLI